MESKNIKIVDEHGIDRDAAVVYAMDVDGTDYVVYSISRDGENDNIFISKIIKNLDGTSSMINIEDSNEKENVFDIVKRMIKFAVNSQDDNLNSLSITLPEDGKNIKFLKTLFNKEQNINVTKTYLTTVKKSVTKVTLDFYRFQEDVSGSQPVFYPNNEENKGPVFPDIFPVKDDQPDIQEPVPVVTPVIDNVVSDTLPAFFSEANSSNITPNDNVTIVNDVNLVSPSKIEPAVEPSIVNVSNAPAFADTVSQENIAIPVVGSQEGAADTNVVVQPEVVSSVNNTLNVDNSAVFEPKLDESFSASVNSDNMLVLDGSKETNLNQALGEVSNEGVQAVSNIESVREFGVDAPANIPSNNTDVSSTNSSDGTIGGQSGFVKSKFFMVIAIIFFLASCVFLGYEAFNYFKIK